MKSRITRPAVLAVLVVLLVSGSVPILAGASSAPDTRASEGYSDLVAYGTSWVPEVRNHFAQWKPFGWGIQAKLKAAQAPTYEWVHIPIPYMSVAEGTAVKLDLVEFCAKSSNGAATKPTDIHLWEENVTTGGSTRFYTGAVTWAPNNNTQCWSVDINPNVWKQSLGISVRLYFANGNDTITLMKAWARVTP